MKQMPNKKGFTLVEAIIAVGIFAIAAVIAGSIMVDISQIKKRTSVQNAIYEDTRIVLQQLTNEIQGGAIDYEEYYNRYVVESEYYGTNYGVYGSRFFDPGRRLDGTRGTNPDDLGIECSLYSGDGSCEIYLTYAADSTTGQHPYRADDPNDQDDADAFCEERRGRCDADTKNIVDELFLIDSTGMWKTIIAPKLINAAGNRAIGLMRMQGSDQDQNGVVDVFSCAEEYNCEDDPDIVANAYDYPMVDRSFVNEHGIRLASVGDRDASFNINSSHLLPISPMRADILDLQFIINPVEDPYKAFAEPDVQAHPSVTIMMTVGLADGVDYPGDFEPITVQTTVTAGVLTEIQSYPPVLHILDSGRSWINDVLGFL